MLHLFLGLKSLVKVSRYHTDGSVFRLHYRVTVMALLAFTFIVTTRQVCSNGQVHSAAKFQGCALFANLKNKIETLSEVLQMGR